MEMAFFMRLNAQQIRVILTMKASGRQCLGGWTTFPTNGRFCSLNKDLGFTGVAWILFHQAGCGNPGLRFLHDFEKMPKWSEDKHFAGLQDEVTDKKLRQVWSGLKLRCTWTPMNTQAIHVERSIRTCTENGLRVPAHCWTTQVLVELVSYQVMSCCRNTESFLADHRPECFVTRAA